jgi:hypothetical protein
MAGTHLLLVSRLRMGGTIPLLPCSFMAWSGTTFNFPITFAYARKILVHQYGSYHLIILRSDVMEEHVLCVESRCYSETMLI